MNRILKTITKGALLAGTLLLALASAPVQAQQVQISLFPPVTFRATNQPVYYEGRAAYWYGGRWYYQRGAEWEYDREEPLHLREYRSNRRLVPRPHYERRHRGFR